MFFDRSLPFLIAVFVSVCLWALGVFLMPPGHSQAAGRGGYAALVCSEAVPDREIRERLEKRGFTGLVSESGQWVLLDSFGGIEQIPLDEYPARILPFDPRNDGYAEKLRSLFVQDDKRFIYIPLGFAAAGAAAIEKRLASSLGDIYYSFEYAGSSPPVGLFIGVFFLIACAFFIFRPLRRALQPHASGLIPCLPALAPLALAGAAGFVLASLFAGFAVLIAVRGGERYLLSYHRELPPVIRRLLPSLLLFTYGILVFCLDISPVFALLVLALACAILLFSLWAAPRAAGGFLFRRQDTEHRRFFPVPILTRRTPAFAFAWAMLPFAAAALALAAVSMASPPSTPAAAAVLPSPALSEEDYRNHYLFQSTFSLKSLQESSPEISAGEPRFSESAPAELSGGMGVYELASDGLIERSADNERSVPLTAIPPFPLNDLLRYLETMKKGF